MTGAPLLAIQEKAYDRRRKTVGGKRRRQTETKRELRARGERHQTPAYIHDGLLTGDSKSTSYSRVFGKLGGHEESTTLYCAVER